MGTVYDTVLFSEFLTALNLYATPVAGTMQNFH